MRRQSFDRIHFVDLPVAEVLSNPASEWKAIRNSGGIRTAAKLDVDWKEFSTDRYIFTHNTIVSSVETEKDGYTIVDPCQELVNANGNSWSNAVLPHCYRTFIGKPVFEEHIEVQYLAKGTILDAVLRPVEYKGSNGKTASVFYVDLLVATERSHERLAFNIENGRLNAMSMGVSVNISQCSVCGKTFKDDKDMCDHLKNHLGEWVEYEGRKKFCSELIGVCDSKGNYVDGSCEFIEASWVEDPAFTGAVLNYFIETPEEAARRVADRKVFSSGSYIDFSYLDKLRVADSHGRATIGVLKRMMRNDAICGSVFRRLS